jgi:hypothetical protein
MSLDYKLHKATEKKAREVLADKKDVQRREQNLIDKIERLQKANDLLTEEQREWNRQRTTQAKRLKDKEKSLGEKDVQSDTVLERLLKSEKQLKKDKVSLKKQLRIAKKKNTRLRAILSDLDKKEEKIHYKELAANKHLRELARLEEKANQLVEKKKAAFLSAKEAEGKAESLLRRVEEKNKEANSLKIRLGIKEKGLNEKQREVARNTRLNKFRRQEMDVIARELQVKRQLLIKAYTLADVEELDTKVEQMIRTEDEQLLPKNRQ